MPTFRNLDEFLKIISDPTEHAINYICDKILTELEVQMVSQGIGTRSNSFYQNTGEFYNAWKQGITENVRGYIKNKVYYDPSEVHSDPSNFVHGSYYWSGGDDVSDILPDLIFGGKSGGLFGEGFWTDERDAWSPTMSRLNKSFGKWLKEGFYEAGFSITKG